MEKSSEIKVRVTGDMKAAVNAIAASRGEGESLIVREAIREYLTRREAAPAPPPPVPAPVGPVTYGAPKPLPAGAAAALRVAKNNLRRAKAKAASPAAKPTPSAE